MRVELSIVAELAGAAGALGVISAPKVPMSAEGRGKWTIEDRDAREVRLSAMARRTRTSGRTSDGARPTCAVSCASNFRQTTHQAMDVPRPSTIVRL